MRIPATTVRIGSVLDLTFERGQERIRVDEWHGWHVLIPENAFDVAPGRARIFLVRGQLRGKEQLQGDELDRAQTAYERWNQRDAMLVGELDVPDEINHRQGRALRIGYRSDKWSRRGTTHDYDHDFTERGHRPPLLYTNTPNLARARAALLVGGDMSITEGGID
jgi:hypothetical protein